MKANLYLKAQHFDNPNFPLKMVYYHQMMTDHHHHDFYELVIVQNGSSKHVTENFEHSISVGDVFVIKPMVKHHYSDPKNLKLINILYCPDKLKIPLCDIRDIPGYCVLFEVEPSLRTRKQFKSRLSLNTEQLVIVEKITSNLYNELMQKSRGFHFSALLNFMELILCLSRYYTPHDSKSSRKLLRVSSMMNFIEHNFQEKITLNEIIHKGHMSLSTANRAFREAIDMTPIDYLIKVRIEHAAELLRTQKISVTEVAMRCGYGDSNYFSKQFTKFMGSAPRHYQKMFNK